MTADSAIFELPPVMKLEDCQKLFVFLQDAQDTPVTLDCSAVTRLGGMGAQIIQMASDTWAMNDQPFSLENMTTECRDSLTTLGFDTLVTAEGNV